MKNKRILVLGMARSGVAISKLLSHYGNEITLTDLKNHPDKYSESYIYQVKDNQLVLTDIKTNESIKFVKNEEK